MLDHYDFSMIRTLRKQKNLTIQQLADLSSLTFPTVIAIENNKSLPSLLSIDQIASALDLTVLQLLLFCQRIKPLSKTADIVDPPEYAELSKLGVCRMVSHGDLQAFLIKGKTGLGTDPKLEHGNVFEFGYVLSGIVEFLIEDKKQTLLQHDTIFFDGTIEHVYKFLADSELLIVRIPKNFT